MIGKLMVGSLILLWNISIQTVNAECSCTEKLVQGITTDVVSKLSAAGIDASLVVSFADVMNTDLAKLGAIGETQGEPGSATNKVLQQIDQAYRLVFAPQLVKFISFPEGARVTAEIMQFGQDMITTFKTEGNAFIASFNANKSINLSHSSSSQDISAFIHQLASTALDFFDTNKVVSLATTSLNEATPVVAAVDAMLTSVGGQTWMHEMVTQGPHILATLESIFSDSQSGKRKKRDTDDEIWNAFIQPYMSGFDGKTWEQIGTEIGSAAETFAQSSEVANMMSSLSGLGNFAPGQTPLSNMLTSIKLIVQSNSFSTFMDLFMGPTGYANEILNVQNENDFSTTFGAVIDIYRLSASATDFNSLIDLLNSVTVTMSRKKRSVLLNLNNGLHFRTRREVCNCGLGTYSSSEKEGKNLLIGASCLVGLLLIQP